MGKRDYSKEYKIRNKELIKINRLKAYLLQPHKIWVRNTLYHHRKIGIIVNIDRCWLIQKAQQTIKCPLCDEKLNWTLGKEAKNGTSVYNSPTLDRIYNEKEMNHNNVQIICRHCNVAKSNRSLEQLFEWAERLLKNKEKILGKGMLMC